MPKWRRPRGSGAEETVAEVSRRYHAIPPFAPHHLAITGGSVAGALVLTGMTADPSQEPPIDLSLSYYTEERALAVALDKASTPDEREKVSQLVALRAELMAHRDAQLQEATAKRHARGEIYSKARVAAINAIGPSKAELDAGVKTRFLRQADAVGVLKSHARAAFGFGLVSQRLSLADTPADILESAHSLQAHEERFAKAWMAAIGDAAFAAEMRERQRETVAMLRTASRPMVFVSSHAPDALDDEDARELGKIWSKLDKLAESLDLTPPSRFIAFDEEGTAGDAPASELLPVIEGLIAGVADPVEKFPGKKKALAVLHKLKDAVAAAGQAGGGGHFEVDL